jgi:predicted enzyme related to lactoylglutathione lyase
MPTKMAKPALDPGIVTADAAPLLAFYRETFGLEPMDGLQIPGVGTIHKLACGHSVLRVMVPETPPEPDAAKTWSGRAGFRYLTFEVTDIQAAVAAARTHGGQIALEPFELRPGRFVCQITDPDGNMLEVGQGNG